MKDYRVIFPNATARQNQQQQHTSLLSGNSPSQAQAPVVLSTSSLGHNHLIPPTSSIARNVMMGNSSSNNNNGSNSGAPSSQQQQKQPMSNLSALLEGGNRQQEVPDNVTTTDAATNACAVCDQPPFSPSSEEQQHRQQQQSTTTTKDVLSTSSSSSSKHNEADLASGPPPAPAGILVPIQMQLGRSAPTIISTGQRRFSAPGTPPTSLSNSNRCSCTATTTNTTTAPSSVPKQQLLLLQPPPQQKLSTSLNLGRRCLSSKELATLAPPSGSPFVEMLNRKDELETKMTERLREMRESVALEGTPSTSPAAGELAPIHNLSSKNDNNKSSSNNNSKSEETSTSSKSTTTRTSRTTKNEDRHRRRAAHNRAVVEDLCDVVADLFVAESKLINPTVYGVSSSREKVQREHVLKSVQTFVSALPTRYALGADTPSEVLLHMRLMAVARSDPFKCVVHIINLDDDKYWSGSNTGPINTKSAQQQQRNIRLVTISCNDSNGLLEYITKLLGTGGSRVLDADVMLSSDRTVLDRFVVEMSGRLRLDKLAQLIEAFLKDAQSKKEHDNKHQDDCSCQDESQKASTVGQAGPLYFNPKHHSTNNLVRRDIEKEIQSAVPLTEVLASPNTQREANLDPQFVALKRHFSMPNALACRPLHGQPAEVNQNQLCTPNLSSPVNTLSREDDRGIHLKPRPDHDGSNAAIDPVASNVIVESGRSPSMRQKRPLVNRRGASDLGQIESEAEPVNIDYVTVPARDATGGAPAESREIPLIPFDELKLIETVGMGRVSTIYRTAWQNSFGVEMVALKVAMVNPETRDLSHVDELRREADIAARLKHPNVVDLVGVAADAECFCLAYDFCEGGSVLSLVSDTSRYYEYLPIALDVANGMAYLHSRDIIHRDLKPSNVLLTRDHRAKIADFGMSVANAGQELTAETGTYRFMAPEVIRHESYSSNADVYSFGVFLWQLITRQVPFASMTPVQAAYAVAEGRRPEIPESTPRRLVEIIEACWDQDSHKRPSFTYIAMALADYAKLSFSPASVGAQTLQIANDMLATVEGNSNINVDFTTSVQNPMSFAPDPMYLHEDDDIGLEI